MGSGQGISVNSSDLVIIVGAGGHGRSVAEIILSDTHCDQKVCGFIDDSWPERKLIWDIPILGDTSDFTKYLPHAQSAVVAIGNNKLRATLQSQLVAVGFDIITVIHPRAIVAPSAKIGVGCTIMAGAVIGTESQLGDGVIVNSGAVVDHHCEVGNYGHLGVGTAMAGGSRLGVGAWLHAGNALGYGEVAADWTVVR